MREAIQIARGESELWFYGRVIYEDVFGNEHEHRFLYSWRPNVHELQRLDYKNYNRSTQNKILPDSESVQHTYRNAGAPFNASGDAFVAPREEKTRTKAAETMTVGLNLKRNLNRKRFSCKLNRLKLLIFPNSFLNGTAA
jgi:hypothetical protein